MDQKYKYLGKNTIIFAISSFGTKVLSFLLVPLYTAVLTTAEYGIADFDYNNGYAVSFYSNTEYCQLSFAIYYRAKKLRKECTIFWI